MPVGGVDVSTSSARSEIAPDDFEDDAPSLPSASKNVFLKSERTLLLHAKTACEHSRATLAKRSSDLKNDLLSTALFSMS